jgi:quinol monooxygenase YgiN
MIILTLSLSVSPTDRKNAVSIFETIAGSISVKPGCKKAVLCSDVNNDDDLMLIEEWESMEEAEQHIGSDEFRKIMAIMDMAVKPPEILFHSISSTMGFELVEKIRERVNSY